MDKDTAATFMFIRSLAFCVGLLAWILGAVSHHWESSYNRSTQQIRTHLPQGKCGSDYIGLVPEVGLEPTRVTPLDFESSTSAIPSLRLKSRLRRH